MTVDGKEMEEEGIIEADEINVELRTVDAEDSEFAPDDDEVAEVLVSAALEVAEAEEEGTVPDPPAALDSCAKPTAGVPLLAPLLEDVVPRKTV